MQKNPMKLTITTLKIDEIRTKKSRKKEEMANIISIYISVIGVKIEK